MNIIQRAQDILLKPKATWPQIAAELAVNYISMGVGESNAKKPVKILETAIHDASQAIASHSAGKEDEEGMGATCACAWVIENKLYTAYVGDSRIYLLRGKFIQRLTIDHTWVQEAYEKGIITAEQMRDHPNVHVIRRHLGGIKLPEVDFRMRIDKEETDEESANNQGFHLEPGDTILMCSDGLTDLVWDDEIQKIVRSKKDLKAAAASVSLSFWPRASNAAPKAFWRAATTTAGSRSTIRNSRSV